MSTSGVRQGRTRVGVTLISLCVVSACRFGYELIDQQSGAGGSGANHGGATASGGSSSMNGGNGFGVAGEGGEPSAGGSRVEGGTGGSNGGDGNGGQGATTQGTGGTAAAGGSSAGSGNGGTAGGSAGGENGGSTGTGGTSAGSGNGGTAGTAGSGGAGGATAGSGNGGTSGASGGGASGTGGGSGAGDLVVTTNADENDAGASATSPGGTGLSLREAITIANATAGAQTITFQTGVVVALTNTLPTITQSTTIRGGAMSGAGLANGRDCMVIGAGPSLVDSLQVTSCPGRPISVTGGNDVQITNCTVTQNGVPLEVGTGAGTGIIIGPGNVISGGASHCVATYNSGTLFIDNRIADCGNNGIFVSGRSADTNLIGNVIVRAAVGIGMGTGTTGTVMWFNTVAQNVSHGINIGQASANDLRNNVVAFNGGNGVVAADARFSQQDFNLFFGNATGACVSCTPGTNSVLLDPRFVNAAADDYRLQAGSPAINAGTAVPADRNGTAAGNFNGAAPDLGYWESP